MNSTASGVSTTPIPPGESDPVRHAVTIATRRLRQRRTIRFGATGFLAGSLVGLVVAVAISTNILQETTLPGGGAFLFLPTLAGLLAGAFVGMAGKYDLIGVARLLERRLELKDRLSTALSAKRDGQPITEAQHNDAMRHAPSEAVVFTAVPLTPVPRRVYIAGALALAVALTYFAPELPVFWSSTRRTEQVAVKKEGERLLAVAKAAAAEAKKQNLPEAEKAAEKVEKLGKEMTRGRMPLREALMQRAKLSEELRKAQDKIAREQTSRADHQTKTDLNGTGRDLSKNLQTSGASPSESAPTNTSDARMKSLQDALARGDKSATAQALREMADAAERGEPGQGPERSKTAKQLAALGDALNKNQLPDAGKAAGQAGDAMGNNAMPEAAQSLRDAADKIEQSTPPASSTPKQSNQNQQSQTEASNKGQSIKEKSALEKLMDEVKQLSGGGQQSSPSGQQGQASSGNQAQNGSPQQGQSGQSRQGGQSGQKGQSPQGSLGGKQQQGQGNQSGQHGAPSGKSGQSNNPGNEPGTKPSNGNQSGAGQGKAPGSGKGGNRGASSNGAGNGSSGSVKTGDSAQRLGKGAREQNVHGKRSGDGPETVITEKDTDRTALPAASLPYYKEYVKERGGPASETAQMRDPVPNAYRSQVRGYFDSLPPAPKTGAKGQ